ncbi:MAG: hypothetical protein ACOXZR_04100 [Bacilli bacterium]|jgi:hypothetical protein
MDILVTEELLNVLMIGSTFSIVLMSIIQKIKKFNLIKSDAHIFIVNFLLSFSIGSLFAYNFYNLNIIFSLWVGFFSFVGSPLIYHLLKGQNIINYKPHSLDEKEKIGIVVPLENKIRREGEVDDLIRK